MPEDPNNATPGEAASPPTPAEGRSPRDLGDLHSIASAALHRREFQPPRIWGHTRPDRAAFWLGERRPPSHHRNQPPRLHRGQSRSRAAWLKIPSSRQLRRPPLSRGHPLRRARPRPHHRNRPHQSSTPSGCDCAGARPSVPSPSAVTTTLSAAVTESLLRRASEKLVDAETFFPAPLFLKEPPPRR